MTNLKEVAAKLNDLKKEYSELAKKEIFNSIKEFFEAYPEVYAIRWEQYTPYFNDGDACTFSVGDAEYFLTEEDLDNGDGFGDYWTPLKMKEDEIVALEISRDRLKVVSDAFIELQKNLSSIDDDVYLGIFGDHAQITATKDGIECDEYFHD